MGFTVDECFHFIYGLIKKNTQQDTSRVKYVNIINKRKPN